MVQQSICDVSARVNSGKFETESQKPEIFAENEDPINFAGHVGPERQFLSLFTCIAPYFMHSLYAKTYYGINFQTLLRLS